MATFHPLFRAQAFQIQPHRMGRTCCHRRNIRGRYVAGKKLDHDIGHIAGCKHAVLIAPMAHRHSTDLLFIAVAGDFRANPLKTAQIVHPQGDGDVMFLL